MRICVVYDCLFPYTVGGAERWYRNLAERLAAEGHEVTYLTLRQWDRGERRIDRARCGSSRSARGWRSTPPSGRRRILPPLVFGARRALAPAAPRPPLRRRAHLLVPLLLAARRRRAAAAARYGLVVDWFEVWSRAYWRDYLGGSAGAIGALVQRALRAVPQRAFCFSELHAARLREEGLRGEVTVLRGLYAGSLEPAPARGRAGSCCSRAADPREAASRSASPPSRSPRGGSRVCRACFYGDGPERAALRAAIAEHGAEAIVSAPGFADAELVDADMRRALCMLLPSRREGYGMVVVEAAARATPSVVVAGEDNAAIELIEEGVNGVVAPSADPEAIAAAIVRVHEAGLALRESTAAGSPRTPSSCRWSPRCGSVLEI